MARPFGLVVLTVHRIVARRERPHDVEWRSLQALIEGVRRSGLRCSTELGAPDEQGVALTFDDGTAEHLDAARVLANAGMRGVFFVPAAQIGETGRLSPADVREIAALGHAIGSHSLSHRRLDRMTPAERDREITASRAALEELTGRGVRYFAPPGGIAPASLAAEVAAAGYEASRSMRWGVYHDAAERFRIPCVPVTELTLRRGWVASAVERGELPVGLELIAPFRALVPRLLRARGRSLLDRIALD